MFTKFLKPLAILLAVVSLTACKKDNNTPEPENGMIMLDFDNVVGDKDLKLNDETYQNESGEDFTVTTLNYYISNIKLTKKDGSEYILPKESSYFLVREADAATQKIKLEVPAGEYKSVTYTVGVDKEMSKAPVEDRKGVLAEDYEHVMYWGWQSGYIFMKLEGKSSVSTQSGEKFMYHIGLFGGYDDTAADKFKIDNIKTITIPFGSELATPKKDAMTMIHLKTDVLKVFNSTKIAEHSKVMASEYSKTIANNYKDAFSLKMVHNNAQ